MYLISIVVTDPTLVLNPPFLNFNILMFVF